jgi:CheY-like chemotaxis protein
MNNKQHRILCLDDQPAPLDAYKLILEPQGYEVLTTESSEEALEIMRREPIDLLIQDIARPRMNGIELYGIMKSDERLRGIPVVISSGAHCEEFLAQYSDAAAVIKKPFDVELLRGVVRKTLQSAATRRDNAR